MSTAELATPFAAAAAPGVQAKPAGDLTAQLGVDAMTQAAGGDQLGSLADLQAALTQQNAQRPPLPAPEQDIAPDAALQLATLPQAAQTSPHAPHQTGEKPSVGGVDIKPEKAPAILGPGSFDKAETVMAQYFSDYLDPHFTHAMEEDAAEKDKEKKENPLEKKENPLMLTISNRLSTSGGLDRSDLTFHFFLEHNDGKPTILTSDGREFAREVVSLLSQHPAMKTLDESSITVNQTSSDDNVTMFDVIINNLTAEQYVKLGQGFAQPIKAPSNQSNVVASIPATTTPPAPDAFQTMLMDAIKNAQHSPQASHEHGPQAPHTPHIPTNAAGHTPEANHPPKEHNPSGPFVQPEPAAAVHAVPQHPAKPVPVTQQPSAQIESPAHVEQALPQEVLQTAAMG